MRGVSGFGGAVETGPDAGGPDVEVGGWEGLRGGGSRVRGSDVVHRGTGRAGEGFDGDLVEGAVEFGGHLVPCVVDGGAGFAFVFDGCLDEGGVDGEDDLAEGDGCGRSGEEVSAGFSAAAFDDSGAAEVVEDLDEKVGGDGFTLR